MKNHVTQILAFILVFILSTNVVAKAGKHYKNTTPLPVVAVGDTSDEDGYIHENPNIPHDLPFSGTCVSGTVNRFTGSYHSNLYIGNNSGTNVLLQWGQNMKLYITGAGANDTTPVLVSPASYAGTPLEVRSSSSGGAAGLSALLLRTSTKLYCFGTVANITAITSMAGFGGASLITGASDVTAKLPAGVSVTNIAQMAISQTALAIVTADSGKVYVLTKVANLQGDSATANGAIWHQVFISGGVTPLTGVTKFSLSSSGAFALTLTGKIYYWGAPANVAGTTNTTVSYKCAYNMSAQIPAGRSVTDLVCLGTKTPSSSTLFILCDNQKVYANGLNTNGALGNNNSTYTTNQATFQTVKDTTGTADLSGIVRIDGDTEADIFCMGAMNTSGQIFGWGDSPAAMLGLPLTGASVSSYPVPKTVRLFNHGSAPGTGYTDFSIAGHFSIAFYTNGSTDQYWYLGHNSGGSIGDPTNLTAFIVATSPSPLNASGGVSFNCSNSQPTITTGGALSPFSSCSGAASASQTFTVSGVNLSSNITVTVPAGYEVSTSAGSGYGATATLTQSGGVVNSTTLYVRLASGATNGASGNIACTSTGAVEVDIPTGSGTVNALPTVTSVTGASRSGAGTLTLAGTASTGATLDWYAASAGGSALALKTLSFITPSISTTTNYFAAARDTTSGCLSAVRTLVTATINGSFSAGSTGTDQSICNGTAPAGLTSVADASGGTGTITYQWQSSTDNTTFNDIGGATLNSYVPSSLTQTTYYRRAATTTADGTIYSNTTTITVNALPVASAPVGNSRTGAGPLIISASASAGATLDWYANATGGLVLAGGNGVLTFTTPAISVTTTYYAQARDNTTGCISTSRLPVVATINGSFSPGSVGADQAICSGSIPVSFTSETDASGGTGTINYQWQDSTLAVPFADITGAIANTFSPVALTQSTYYRRVATTTTDGSSYSNIVAITVNSLPNVPGAVNGSRSGPGTVLIAVTVDAGETADWYDVPTSGSILSGGTGTTGFTTPFITNTADYYAQARNTTSGCISAGRTIVTATINAILPVTILNFSAKKLNTTVLLNWSTASELNSKNFVVQFSTDGQKWTNIGTVAAAGNSNVIQSYSFVHNAPVTGVNYYRLLLQDVDGHFSFSIIASVYYTLQDQAIIVYPNPVVAGNLNVQLQKPAIISLYNDIGQLVLRQQFYTGNQQIDVSRLAKGLYQLKAGTAVIKIVIQ